MIKGKEKQQQSGGKSKFIGFTSVELRAINPSRAELNTMLDKEASDDDKEMTYLGEDKEGNKRVRIAAWLYDPKIDEYFVHSFNITDKIRISKDGVKTQYINTVCTTSWAETEADLPKSFTRFTDKGGNELGEKKYRKALLGEEELAILMRATLGGLNWSDPETEVSMKMSDLFSEDYEDLRSMIGSNYQKPFVILTGVKTDENDFSKQYQSVWGKSFLPNGFMEYINKTPMVFPSNFSQKVWDRFETEVTGEYGFQSYYDLVPLKEYDSNQDVATAEGTRTEDVTAVNSKY